MSKPLKVQIVEKARALIEDEKHWCRGELARDADGHDADAGQCPPMTQSGHVRSGMCVSGRADCLPKWCQDRHYRERSDSRPLSMKGVAARQIARF
jgi:hypothetical protein